jgi:hypothetical protein
MALKQRCKICKRLFLPRTTAVKPKYCHDPQCKKEAKRRWKSQKLRDDEHYRFDQADAYRAFMKRNPDYWREYRRKNPEYVERNRRKQSERNERRKGNPKRSIQEGKKIAKGDELTGGRPVISGLYILIPLDSNGIAKGDALLAMIYLLSIC